MYELRCLMFCFVLISGNSCWQEWRNSNSGLKENDKALGGGRQSAAHRKDLGAEWDASMSWGIPIAPGSYRYGDSQIWGGKLLLSCRW